MVASVVLLMMQLEGEEAVAVLQTIMECVPLCAAGQEEGMEDGEISSAATAQSQLLEGIQQVMVRRVQLLSMSTYLSVPLPSSSPVHSAAEASLS